VLNTSRLAAAGWRTRLVLLAAGRRIFSDLVIEGAKMMAMGLRATCPVLVGRQGEIARLVEALDVAAEGGSAVALVAGEAGVGKTRLVQEFASRADGRGFHVCIGRCVDLGEEIWPLAPLREVVAALVDELDGDTLDLVLGGARGVLAHLVPELGGERAGEPPVSSDRLCELVVGMFKRLAQRDPLLVVVEDLHWADATTRTLFSALAQVGRLGPLLLVGTFRSDELHRRHPLRPLLAEIERGRCERIEVRPFDRAATAKFINAIDGVAADRSYVSDVHRRSGGNPFFVEELVAARVSGVAGLPDSLRDVILARAATLDDTAVELLGVAAAAGATVPDVLADVCRLGTDALRTSLDGLFADALLVPDGDEVRFRHELGREVFYDELVPGERARVHAQLARSVERRRPQRLGEIARHWSSAHDAPRALAASVAAGRHALQAGAAAEAEGHLGRALELWDTVEGAATLAGLDHAALLVETATAAEHARHFDQAIELARQAVAELAGIEAMREAQAWLELRDLYRFTNRWDECADAVARALNLIPESLSSGARAMALAHASAGHTYANRFDEALAPAREAVAVAEAVGDPAVIVYAQHALTRAVGARGDNEAALALALANLERCGPRTSAELTLTVYNDITHHLSFLGRYGEIPPFAERGVELARRSGLGGPRGAWMASYWVESLTLLGRWTEAERVVGELADLLESPSEEGQLAWSWGLALTRQGRFEEARPIIEEARAVLATAVWAEDRARQVAAVVEFDDTQGCHADAAALVDEFFDRTPGAPLGEYVVVAFGSAALADWAQAARIRRLEDAPEQAVATARRWIGRIDALPRRGYRPGVEQQLHRDHALAQLGRLQGNSDPQQWARLATGWEQLGFRYHQAAARFRQAEALLAGTAGRAASTRRAAADELAAAYAIAQELRAAPLMADIDDLAGRARLPLDMKEPSDRPLDDRQAERDLGLTPRELDVLDLLARGRSNGQVGKELFISTKTASVHVSNILRKLGVTNRVEAAAFAVDHQLTTTRRSAVR
jgi:DNA-binding CsgD family transcriptional regulator